jgi:hypothetical protein
MKTMLGHFSRMVAGGQIDIYNEFSLQHEFGLFLRKAQQDSKVQFERNVSFFFDQRCPSVPFHKAEMDVAVFSPDKTELHYAIEFKYPRNGQYPAQMYSFCKDIAFAEQLKAAGFRNAYFIAFADDRLFYEGAADGIYGYFRGGTPLSGRIQKPIGEKPEWVDIAGRYDITWEPVSGSLKYMLVAV